jgi:RNA polymerase sigma-70 factor (ECF subfamily)
MTTMARSEGFAVEEPVIEAIQGGDRYAFSEFMGRHCGWVRSVIYGVLGRGEAVEDVGQQVWLLVWQRIGKLQDVRRWRTWLYRIARNAAIDAGRDVTRRRDRARKLAEQPVTASAPGPDRNLMAEEKHQEVLEAVQSLPTIYREPFVMRHMNGWSYAQIAEAMGMPLDSVETRLVRARRFLRATLKEKA